MKFYPSDFVEKIRKLRKQGRTLRELEKIFHVPNSTISKWVKDIPSKNAAYKRAFENEQLLRNQFKHTMHAMRIDQNSARLMLSLLYWCEGSKYPSSNAVGFTNSDYILVKTFLKLLRISFSIDEKKLAARLQIHTTHNYNDILAFWSKL